MVEALASNLSRCPSSCHVVPATIDPHSSVSAADKLFQLGSLPEMSLIFREPLLQFGDQRMFGHACGPHTGAKGVVHGVAVVVGDLHAAV